MLLQVPKARVYRWNRVLIVYARHTVGRDPQHQSSVRIEATSYQMGEDTPSSGQGNLSAPRFSRAVSIYAPHKRVGLRASPSAPLVNAERPVPTAAGPAGDL